MMQLFYRNRCGTTGGKRCPCATCKTQGQGHWVSKCHSKWPSRWLYCMHPIPMLHLLEFDMVPGYSKSPRREVVRSSAGASVVPPPLLGGHSRSIPQGMIFDVQPLVKSRPCPIRQSPNGFFDSGIRTADLHICVCDRVHYRSTAACSDSISSPHCSKPSLPLKKPKLCVYVCLPACLTN